MKNLNHVLKKEKKTLISSGQKICIICCIERSHRTNLLMLNCFKNAYFDKNKNLITVYLPTNGNS